MKIEILQVSKSKTREIIALENEYERRIRPFFDLSIISFKASGSDEAARALEEEKKAILAALDQEAYKIILDPCGTSISSEEFAELLKNKRDFGPGKCQIVIGGSHGLHPEILKLADFRLSFSKMTFTHEMIRVFLREQIYRAACIIVGKSYHK